MSDPNFDSELVRQIYRVVLFKHHGGYSTLKENAETIVAATREIGLKVSADKSKYMVMSRDQNAERIQC